MLAEAAFFSAVGEKVRAARQLRNLTQAQLAERIGMERSSVANIERGNQRLSIYVLYTIGSVLDFPFVDLLPQVPRKTEAVKTVDVSVGYRNVAVPESFANILGNLNLALK